MKYIVDYELFFLNIYLFQRPFPKYLLLVCL